MSKKKDKPERKRRKKEMSKKGKVQNINQASLEKVPSPQEQIQNLKVGLMQIDQQEGQVQLAYAQSFINIFSTLAIEYFKAGNKDAITAAQTDTESIRLATHDYTDQLKSAAPLDPRLVQAREQANLQLAQLEAIVSPEVVEEKVVEKASESA